MQESILDHPQLICPVCQEIIPFTDDDTPRRFFCSSRCYDIYHSMPEEVWIRKITKRNAADPGVCAVCGMPFEHPGRSDRFYCGPGCQRRARKMGIRARDLYKIRILNLL